MISTGRKANTYITEWVIGKINNAALASFNTGINKSTFSASASEAKTLSHD